MPKKSAAILYEEIHSAIHALLSGHQEEKNLFWTSVGLLDETNEIIWKSHVNDKCDLAPCYQVSARTCSPRTGVGKPPCLREYLDDLCEFRKNLYELERITMKDDSFSMGELSKRYFENVSTKGEHPYISIEELIDYPWIASRDLVLNKLGLEDKSTEASKKYREMASKCMFSGTIASLIPLVKRDGDLIDYLGAIVVCAKKGSDIWQHLPRMKATALSLIQVHMKNVNKMTSDKATNLVHILLTTLLHHPFGQHLYSNHNGWHTNQSLEADLKRHERLFAHCDTPWQQQKLPISLFNYLQTGSEKEFPDWKINPRNARLSVAKDVIPFFENFGLKVTLKSTDFLFNWPTSPGLIGLACLIDINNALIDVQKDHRVENIELFYDSVSKDIYWTFISNHDLTELGDKWLSSYYAKHDAGLAVRTIWERMFADLSSYGIRFAGDRHAHANSGMFEKLLERTNRPIFQVGYKNKELSLMWRFAG